MHVQGTNESLNPVMKSIYEMFFFKAATFMSLKY